MAGSSNLVWRQNFTDGGQYSDYMSTGKYYIHPARYFSTAPSYTGSAFLSFFNQ